MKGSGQSARCNRACADEPLPPMTVISLDEEDHAEEDTCKTSAFLEEVQAKLTSTVVVEMRHRLEKLTADLHKVAGEAPGSPRAVHLSPRAFASAIKESLEPTIDSLENEASQLTQELSLSVMPSTSTGHASSSEFAASVVSELLPPLRVAVTTTIQDIMTPGLSFAEEVESGPVLLGQRSHSEQELSLSVMLSTARGHASSSEFAASAVGELLPPLRGAVTTNQNTMTPGLSFAEEVEPGPVLLGKRSHSYADLMGSSPLSKDSTQTHRSLDLYLNSCDSGPMSSCENTSGAGLTPRHVGIPDFCMPLRDITQNRPPARAFVINFQRLLLVQKVLSLIHLFIKSTAIATLTLVSSAYWTDLLFSLAFVTLVLAVYAIHEIRYDRLDIDDYRSFGDLLEDDNAYYEDPRREHVQVQNPNRLLKALTLVKSCNRKQQSLATIIAFNFFIGISWMSIFWSWFAPKQPRNGLWFGFLNADDIAVMATQMLIGSLTFLFHAVYEWLYWRETQCKNLGEDEGPWCWWLCWRPKEKKEKKGPWDPRQHDVPQSHSWFGLPSM